jgi:hypothetical protein
VDTDTESKEESFARIVRRLEKLGYLPFPPRERDRQR